MITKESSAFLQTEVGTLRITGTADGVWGVHFMEEGEGGDVSQELLPPPLKECLSQLKEYFEGKRKEFYSLRLLFRSTVFQQDVWDAVRNIPFGETVSYLDIAKEIGKPDAVRAVGQAASRNHLAIIVPCHRIVPASSSTISRVLEKSSELGGYAWGSWRKEWLLKHEGVV